MHDAFAQALKWRIVKFNPFTGLQLPKVEKTRPLCVDPAQALAFVEVIRPHRLFPALMMMLSLGLRRGEVCGLRRNTDVDLGRGIVRVDGTLQYLKREIHWGSPKSTESRRTLRLPSFLQAILIAHYAAQDELRAKVGEKWKNAPYIFTTLDGAPLNPNILYVVLKDLTAGTEFSDMHPHALRHNCVAFLIAQNVHAKVISQILGHVNIGITMNLYGHLFPTQLNAAIDDLGDFLTGSETLPEN